ncbi:hypothetical protein [Paludibaculum fermentans]|uniref:Uncharacterized protein n=1 Tax=Paludibaculum fermentans TaxID=1473598 RepID=A0A7S7NQE6_PALFE|nr:hypothetical protein [Paludibaculum fermentans]QOY87799.1 hypothetical protein IRI77_34520 [Paludibaculum fermentans]
MAQEMPEVSTKLLRQALLESGLVLTPMVEGVRQDSFRNLERTLLALGAEYEAGDPARRKEVRGLVITARQHADWAMRNPNSSEAHKAEKTEMVLWLRTWLENPPLFPAWLLLRNRVRFEDIGLD